MKYESARFLVSKCMLWRACGLGLLLWAAFGVVLPRTAGAQSPAASAVRDDPEPEPEQPSPKSPRAAFSEFLELGRKGDYSKAAAYLDLAAPERKRGSELAQRLRAVLERHASTDLTSLSPEAAGDLDDGASAQYEIVGRVPMPDGDKAPVRLRRVYGAQSAPYWVFSPGTVRLVDGWYARLENRWLLERLPPWFLQQGPKGLLLWQWLAVPVIFVLALGLSLLLSRATQLVLGALASKTSTTWDDDAVRRLGGPGTLLWLLAVFFLVMPTLDLHPNAEDFIGGLLRGFALFAGFWALSRLVEAWGNAAANSAWAEANPSARGLVPFATRVGKVVVFAMGVVALVSAVGYPAASLLAGLGVGGLAIALAGQKTVENLFGAVSIGVDQPFRVGDLVKIEDFTGTVESIGLRSTRVRTADRTVITLPNGRLSEMRVESFTARDRLRLSCTLALAYHTTAAQMRAIIDGTEGLLRRHPKLWPDTVVVKFKEFGDSALLVEVAAWFLTTDWNEFVGYRQDILLEIMQLVEKVGSSFAFPTRTIHLEQQGATSRVPEQRPPALPQVDPMGSALEDSNRS